MELRTNTLSYVPRGEREQYIEAIVTDYRREARLANVSHAALPAQQRLPPQRLHEGMKTALDRTPNPCFSLPTNFGSATATVLQKQRKAERAALKRVNNMLTASSAGGSAASSRKLPW